MLRRIEGKNWTAIERGSEDQKDLKVVLVAKGVSFNDTVGKFAILVLRNVEGTISGQFYCDHIMGIGKKWKKSRLSFASFGKYTLDGLEATQLEGKHAEIYIEDTEEYEE